MLKKGVIAMALAISCVLLGACGSPRESAVSVEVRNPVTEYNTMTALDEAVGFKMVALPESTGLVPVRYEAIDKTLAQVVYERPGSGKDERDEAESTASAQPKAEVTVRMAQGDENISGIYGIEDYGVDQVHGVKVNVGEYNGVLVTWFAYEGESYSLTASGLDVAVFEDMEEALVATILKLEAEE
jgi:hypothetical protein